MYKVTRKTPTSIKRYEATEGEPIEHKIERIVNNKEAIQDGAPIIHTLRKDGVVPAYNPRTDRMEIAVDAMDKAHNAQLYQRDAKIKPIKKDDKPKEPNSDAKTGGTTE